MKRASFKTDINKFVFDVVTDRQINKLEKKLIKEKMDYYLEPGLTLKINRVMCIKRQTSGKIKHFFSEISD